MAIFPEINPDYGYLFYPKYSTEKIGPTDGDVIQRRRLRSTPLYTAELSYKNISITEERQLIDFIIARQGSYESFVFYDFVSRVYTGDSLGTGDGSTTTFTTSVRDATSIKVYIDSVETTAYTHGNRTGGNGQDQITFTTAPGDTTVLTIDYTAKKYLPICVFREDYLKSSAVSYLRFGITNNIIIDQVSA